MKILRILFLLLMFPALCSAGSNHVSIVRGPSGPTTDSEITFYFNCDANTATQTPTKGSGSVTVGSSATTATGQVSNALDTNDVTDASGRIVVESASNINADVGTIGRWIYVNTALSSGDYLIYSIYSPVEDFRLYANSATQIIFNYRGASVIGAVDTGGWYFVEVAWSTTADEISIRVNGGTWTETAMTSAAPTLGAGMQFGSSTGYGGSPDILQDQLLISNIYQKDLYALRNNTSF